MPTTVRSHAKINLGLGIGAPRADGFHALATVYQTMELHDLVTFECAAGRHNSAPAYFERPAGPDGRQKHSLEDGGAGA